MILLCLIPLAVLFEFLEEQLEEHVTPRQSADHHQWQSKPIIPEFGESMHMHASYMFKTLSARVKGELMVLGFLAFVVWSVTQINMWEEFVPPKHHFNKFPQDWHTLHAVVDAVHMHLFIAMCLHFLVVCVAIWNGAFVINMFVNTQIFKSAWFAERRGEAWEGFPSQQEIHDPLANDMEKRRMPLAYSGMPAERYKDIYSKLTTRITSLCATDKSTFDVINLLTAYLRHHCKQRDEVLAKRDKDTPVDFSMYFALCVNEVLHDIIHFSAWSWLLCFLMYAFFGIMSKVLGDGDEVEYVMMAFNLCAVVLFGIFEVFMRMKMATLTNDFNNRHEALKEQELNNERESVKERQETVEIRPSDSKGNDDTVQAEVHWFDSVEHHYIDIAQALTFMSCFSLARIVSAKRVYDPDTTDFTDKEWLVAFYLVLYIVNGFYFVPRALSWAAIVFSMPPHMDKKDQERLEQVMAHRPVGLTRDDAYMILKAWPKHIQKAANVNSFVENYDNNVNTAEITTDAEGPEDKPTMP